MAEVRGRGGCAQRLATVWDSGRSRQVLLANLPSTPMRCPPAFGPPSPRGFP